MPHRPMIRSRRRLVLLAAAAMLAALLVGGAIAIGFGLRQASHGCPTRRPTRSVRCRQRSLSPLPCDPDTGHRAAPDRPERAIEQGVNASDPSSTCTTMVSSCAVRCPRRSAAHPGQSVGSRLHGVETLVAAIEESGLGDCKTVPVAGRRTFDLKVRTAAGVVSMTLANSGWFRSATDREMEAAQALADRLTDPHLGLPAAQWMDAKSGARYAHDRWEVRISRWDGGGPGSDGDAGAWRGPRSPFLTIRASYKLRIARRSRSKGSATPWKSMRRHRSSARLKSCGPILGEPLEFSLERVGVFRDADGHRHDRAYAALVPARDGV